MKRLLFLTGLFFANSIMVNAQNEKSDNGLYTFDKQIPSYVELTDRGASSQDQAVLETQNSGCLSRTRGYMDEWIPAIVLKKEGSILSVEVQNFISNCGTSDFVVNFSMSDGNNGEPCTLSAEVLPVISEEDEEDCMCPFNVSFTVRDFDANTFFLDCGWYKGQVELKDGDAVIYQSDYDLPVVIDETNFPDAAFRKYVGYQYDKNQDGILNDEEISEAMSMFLFDGDISDVKGIEFFTALQQLYCTGAQIESLDLSKCVSLTTLECYDNSKLSILDVSGCKALTSLNCSGCQLTSLDITNLASLTSLNCNNNALTSLDVSHNTELHDLRCSSNQLTILDLTQNEKIVELFCTNNLLSELDLSHNSDLVTLYCWDNQLKTLDVSKNTKVTSINCYKNGIGESQMGTFVESLPAVEQGYLVAFDSADSNEGNVINIDIVAIANTKGWFVKDQSGWYIGDDPTISNNDFRTWTEGEVSMWFTITSWENKTCKVNHAISEQTEGHVTIPSEANGFTVTGIGQSAFHGCNKITGISIPETVTSIEADAFGGCNSLTSVVIPNSVREVGIGAFWGCSGLTSVTLSESMYEISIELFDGCTSLTSVTIPEGVSTIGGAAFEGCSSLTSVSIPDWIETIGGLAFENCTSLASISLPSRLQLLGNGAFHNCSSLTSITIPDGVYRLDSYTFGGCSSLTSVTIGSGVGNIEDHVFSDCSVLADVYCKAESVPKTDILAFDSTDISHVTLHVPKSAKEAYQSTRPWSEFGKIVAIGGSSINYTQMLRNGASWIYTMFSPSLYQFYEEQGGLTHLASKEVEYRVYDVQESDGRTNYLVKEELLLPGTRGMNSTRAYQGNYLALREEGGRVMAGYDDYMSFLESSDQIVNAGDPSYIPYPKTDEGELILYDFTLQEGDKYAAEVDGHPEIIVEKVDSFIDEVGKARRQLTLSNGCIIIEGIGCINSRGMLLSYLNPGEPIDDYIFWLSFNDDGNELVYHNEVDVSSLGIADCSVPSPNGADGTVYTLGGVRLKSPSKGINIIRQNDGTVKKRIILE